MKTFVLICSLLFGCTSIDINNRVEGWPVLKEELHVVSSEEMHAVCDQYGGFGEIVFSCAEIYFNAGICKIWVTSAGGWTEEHERQHCLGYDHVGGTSMKRMLDEATRNRH